MWYRITVSYASGVTNDAKLVLCRKNTVIHHCFEIIFIPHADGYTRAVRDWPCEDIYGYRMLVHPLLCTRFSCVCRYMYEGLEYVWSAYEENQ